MTTIDPANLKKGDRIRYSRVVTVERDGVQRGWYGLRIHTKTESGELCEPSLDGLEIELLERPLPEEPPIGSVVIFHHAYGVEAWKRWGDHLGWLHAGNSTPRPLPNGEGRRRQGETWQALVKNSPDVKRTVITP